MASASVTAWKKKLMFRIHFSTRAFERLICSIIGLVQLLCAHAVNAAECGSTSPDYTARRTLIIGSETKISKVYVSGSKVREEENSPDGKKLVVLRLPDQGVGYVFDSTGHEALLLPLPPRPDAPKNSTRQTLDKHLDGTVVQRLQLLSGGEWKDISTTTCRADNVMIERAFTFIDQQGKLLAGSLTQSDIDVRPLPKTTFEVPQSVAIRDPRNQHAGPLVPH
jgi:hypothetical protein